MPISDSGTLPLRSVLKKASSVSMAIVKVLEQSPVKVGCSACLIHIGGEITVNGQHTINCQARKRLGEPCAFAASKSAQAAELFTPFTISLKKLVTVFILLMRSNTVFGAVMRASGMF